MNWVQVLQLTLVAGAFECAATALFFRHRLAQIRHREEILAIEAALLGDHDPDPFCLCGEERSSHRQGSGQCACKNGTLCIGFTRDNGGDRCVCSHSRRAHLSKVGSCLTCIHEDKTLPRGVPVIELAHRSRCLRFEPMYLADE